jgi:YcaO-like protein with predicted kinase domain
MPALGISRVTDITRLDRLGMPVFASIRPRGLTLRVHAGKGLHPEEAQASALMEAVEYASAEPQSSRWAVERLSIADVAAQLGERLRLADLIPQLGAKSEPSRIVPCVACADISSGRTTFLPAELVFVPYEVDGAPALFGWTTNGLASGNSLEEATLHALFEVLERDAVSMNKPRDASQWVDVEDLPQPVASACSTWRAHGVELSVRHVPNACSLPCFEACLHDAHSADVNVARGMGLHVDREIALARAVCEAAQSRLSCIHGGREDVTDFYAKYDARNRDARDRAESALLQAAFDKTRRIDFEAVPGAPLDAPPLSGLLDDLLQRLSGAGFGSVLRHRFSVDLNGLHVVKVIVPKCEDVVHDRRRIGPRLLARIVGDG